MPSHSRSHRGRGTLALVAAEVGVSRTSVSNAYNRPEQLSPELRARILSAAEALGYPGPNPTARSLRTHRVGAVGVILTEHLSYAFEDQASIDFLAGLARRTDYSLSLIPVGPGGQNPTLVTEALVDGFVVYSVPERDPHLAAARKSGLPIVICDQPAGTEGIAYVGIDDFGAIEPAARSLVDAGHRRIAILTKRLFRTARNGPVDRAECGRAELHVQRGRVLGALEVFDAAGIKNVPIFTRHFNDRASAVDGARELLQAHPDITAVLCTTDSMALGVMDYCEQRGLVVGRDLSVTGFDGIENALRRGLTTVKQPHVAKGEKVGSMLRALISGSATPTETEVILDTQFIPGRSVAAPRPRL